MVRDKDRDRVDRRSINNSNNNNGVSRRRDKDTRLNRLSSSFNLLQVMGIRSSIIRRSTRLKGTVTPRRVIRRGSTKVHLHMPTRLLRPAPPSTTIINTRVRISVVHSLNNRTLPLRLRNSIRAHQDRDTDKGLRPGVPAGQRAAVGVASALLIRDIRTR